MDINEILTAVSTVGFPIAACGAMFWKNWKTDQAHKEEIDGLKNVISENTVALVSIKQLIEDKMK